MTSCSRGEASRIEASPNPASNTITGKPIATPARWGKVRPIPKRAPDAASIALLGPGVNPITSANSRTAVKVWKDMGCGA
jgi:hypothetical protein